MPITPIYCDYNATTPLHPEVYRFLKKEHGLFGNPSSLHKIGQAARNLIETARYSLATWVDAKPEQLVFTSSASEANNWVLKMIVWPYILQKIPSHIIVSAVEHPSVQDTVSFLEASGVEVSYLRVDGYGHVNPAELEALIRPSTRLVSVMMANNETGTWQDTEQLCSIAHQHGVLFHTDAVQAMGKIPVSFLKGAYDFMTVSGHKFYGPKGGGCLILKEESRLMPLIHGGAQERGLRAGTESTWGISGMGKAAELASKEMEADQKRIAACAQLFWSTIQDTIRDVCLNGHPEYRLQNTLNLSFLGVNGEALMMNLDLVNIAVSTGSACSTGSIEPSQTLVAMGISPDRLASATRFSFGKWTTEAEIERVCEETATIVKRLRAS